MNYIANGDISLRGLSGELGGLLAELTIRRAVESDLGGEIVSARGLLILNEARLGGVQLVVIGAGRPWTPVFLFSAPNSRVERGYTHNDVSSAEPAT